jgi:hypothetical protein
MKRTILFATLGAVLLLVGSAHADTERKADRDLERAQIAYEKAERSARMIGKKRLHHENRMKRLDDVIDRLEAGHDVSPTELDALIR